MNKFISAAACAGILLMLGGCSAYDSSYSTSNADTSDAVSDTADLTSIITSEQISDTLYSFTENYAQDTFFYTEEPAVSFSDIRFTENSYTQTLPPETSNAAVSTAVSENPENNITVIHPSPNIYGYTPKFYQLNSDEQTAYDEIVKGMILLKDEIPLSVNLTEKQFLKVYHAVMTTMEQQFYAPIREYTLVSVESTGFIFSMKPVYGFSADELDSVSKTMSVKADEIMSSISADMSDVDIIKLFHDTIILNCDYSSESINSGNAYGALIEGNALCEGYSRAMSYLCLKAGIPCEIVTGTADGVPHMWNMVELDGKWYNIDLTWDDPVFNPPVSDYISYSFFNVTDSQIQKTHTPDNSDFTYPVAYSTDADYFVYYNLYIDNSENANDIIYNGIASAVSEQQNFAVFRFGSQQIFDEVTDNLFSNAWNGFFAVIDDYNAQNTNQIDKSCISIKKNTDELVIRISF